MTEDESRPTNYIDIANDDGNHQTVYEQYWQHARHVENQLWSFTRIWAVVLTAILTIVGTNLPVPAQAGAVVFGFLLSLMGLFMVYTLRVPFLAFTIKSEAIVVNEFDVDISYTRFVNDWVEFDDDGEVVKVILGNDKGIDMPDILSFVYALVMGIMILIGFNLAGRLYVGVVLGSLTAFTVITAYRVYAQPIHETRVRELVGELFE